MIVNKTGCYDVTYGYIVKDGETFHSDKLTFYGIEIEAGEDVEEVCEDWLNEDVKDPEHWFITDAVLQKKGGK